MLAAVLILAVHIGPAGTVVVQLRWTEIAVNILVALVVVKIALIAWARLAIRRRGASKAQATPDQER